jgi:Sulfotransferase family
MDGPVSVVLNGAVRSADVAAPVFVLCMGRSGSTLLRFLLDAHPDLACPPETSLPAPQGRR